MDKSSTKITIKKYANRRLYDTESSTYITLDRLAAMIREGRDFEVVDAKSGDDITRTVLTQIIVDEEACGSTMLPVNFLRQLIGLYGNSIQGMVPQYLESAMDAFQRNHTTIRDTFGGTMLADLAKRNMAMFDEASRALQGGTATPPAAAQPTAAQRAATQPEATQPDSPGEVEKLRAELASLQAKVDKLGR